MRRFVAPLAIVALGSLPALPAGAALTADGRTFVAGRFALELDGKAVGFLKSVEGGAITAEVVTEESSGGGAFPRKHIAGVKYEDITIEIGMSSDAVLWDWLSSFFERKAARKNGAIILCDFDFKTRARHEFTDALITEVTIPALDGSAKDPAYLKIKISPETIQYKPADGSKLKEPAKKQKQFLPSNFRFDLGSLPTTKVRKIDSFTIKQKVVENPVGELREIQREPGALEYPNLAVYVSAQDAKAWVDFHENFVVKGQNSDADEVDGSINLLDPSGKTFIRIDLHHVGIYRLLHLVRDSNPDQAIPILIGLYVEQMDFTRTP